ncbi:MAG: hypothetical protein EOO75_09200 [Myxococcales bacterium]|nr:MAG: hypothetical protein EOO75_09200 [Myxococcales bacterium]
MTPRARLLLLLSPLVGACADPDPTPHFRLDGSTTVCPGAATPSPPDAHPSCPADDIPKNVTGESYELRLANSHNGCEFQGWEDVPLHRIRLLTQETNSSVIGSVAADEEKVEPLYVPVAGLTGRRDGESLELVSVGEETFAADGCVVRWRVNLHAQTHTSGFEGTLTYHSQLVSGPASCTERVSCTSMQLVTAVRTSP